MESKLVLTPSALLTFLSQIEEIDQDLELGIDEGEDQLTVHIGESVYVLESADESEVPIDDSAFEDVEDIDQEGYDIFEDEIGELTDDEPIEGGILKELAKTLYVGGLVRLTKNAISKM